MNYQISGHFIESCDCTVICPCWVDDDPVGGHCTGFIAWQIAAGGTAGVDKTPVGGCRVVSVASHGGNRRDTNKTTTMLYIDLPEPEAPAPADAINTTAGTDGKTQTKAPAKQQTPPDPDAQYRVLVALFSGHYGGPLSDLAQVNGTLVDACRARISISPHGDKNWRVTVRPHDDQSGPVCIDATGSPKIFDERRGNTEPLTLEHTAISYELSASGSVEAQDGECLVVHVGALPGGHLEVVGRSGMRGKFSYDHPADKLPARKTANPGAPAPASPTPGSTTGGGPAAVTAKGQ